MFIAYFSRQTKNRELFAGQINHILRSSEVNNIFVNNKKQNILFFSFYDKRELNRGMAVFLIDNHLYVNKLKAKLALLKSSFTKNTQNGSLIVFFSDQCSAEKEYNCYPW